MPASRTITATIESVVLTDPSRSLDGRRREDPRLSRAWHDRSTGLVRGPAPQLASHDVVGRNKLIWGAPPNCRIHAYRGMGSGLGAARGAGGRRAKSRAHTWRVARSHVLSKPPCRRGSSHDASRDWGAATLAFCPPPILESIQRSRKGSAPGGGATHCVSVCSWLHLAGGTWLHLAPGARGINCASEVGRFGGW